MTEFLPEEGLPRGTRHDVIGLLNGNWPFPNLRVKDGGTWRLHISLRHRHLIGQQVRVIGTRSDFDLLDVQYIEAI